MKPCPTCAREIPDADTVCEACEAWAAAFAEPRPSETSDAGASTAEPSEPQPVAVGAPAPAPPVSAERPRRQRQLAIIAGVVAAVALTGFAMSAGGGAQPDASPAATASAASSAPAPNAGPAPAAAPAKAPAPAAAPLVQTWSSHNQASWLDNPRRGAAFELPSENIVKTWLGPVRPLLVVRCASQRIDAFVVTGSPMKIDPRVEGKAVTVSVDGEPFRTEHWVDSERHTSVFAPQPTAFVERLRAARTLHFGYTPHNSGEVVAQFHVAGIGDLMSAASKHCAAK